MFNQLHLRIILPIQVLTISLWFASPTNSFGANSNCKNALADIVFIKDESHVPKVAAATTETTGVVITGEATYSTPLILARLGLDDLLTREQKNEFTVTNEYFVAARLGPQATAFSRNFRAKPISNDKISGKNVLSLGEGYSGLTPFLRTNGATALGLDLWYGKDVAALNDSIGFAFIKIYQEKFKDVLITGDATDLKNVQGATFTEIADNSMDYVVSHMMFDYLSPEAQLQALQEALRVLKTNGEIRIYSSAEQVQIQDILELAKKLKIDQPTSSISLLVLKSDITIEAVDPQTRFTQYRKNVDSFEPETFQEILTDSVRPPPVRNTNRDDPGLLIVLKKHG